MLPFTQSHWHNVDRKQVWIGFTGITFMKTFLNLTQKICSVFYQVLFTSVREDASVFGVISTINLTQTSWDWDIWSYHNSFLNKTGRLNSLNPEWRWYIVCYVRLICFENQQRNSLLVCWILRIPDFIFKCVTCK